MSGGPYGRGKAPDRACMKLAVWPMEDRKMWELACRPADILDIDAGSRSAHSGISNRKAAQGYGRWLTYLTFFDRQVLPLAPGARITPERVKAYVEHLQGLGNSSQTLLARLQELSEVAKVMYPAGDLSFINRMAARIRSKHKPARSKAHLKLSDELVNLGFALMQQAEAKSGLDAAILFRDGLIIGFLALVPLRRRNLARLHLGQNLVESGGKWFVMLGSDETKTRGVLELQWPEVLLAPLKVYLELYRPHLMAREGRWTKPVTDELWVSKDGSPMTEIAIYDRVSARTGAAFDKAMNPHLFRDAAATTLAIGDPAHVRVAAPLLGHRTFATTEKYYHQASAMSAHRDYVAAICERRKKK